MHVWEKGDNLLIITNRYKITVEKLKRLNPSILDWNNVDIGTEIKVR